VDSQNIQEKTLMQMLVTVVYCIERAPEQEQLSNHQKKATKEGSGPDEVDLPRSSISESTFSACMLLCEVFGVVIRATVASLDKRPLLTVTGVLCAWLLQHRAIVRMGDERSEFLRVGLAQLVNALLHTRAAGTTDQSTVAGFGDEDDFNLGEMGDCVQLLHELQGLAPLDTSWAGLWVQLNALQQDRTDTHAESDDVLNASNETSLLPTVQQDEVRLVKRWVLGKIRDVCSLLVHQPTTGLYSAFRTPKRAIQQV
jgi:hypothetical protein